MSGQITTLPFSSPPASGISYVSADVLKSSYPEPASLQSSYQWKTTLWKVAAIITPLALISLTFLVLFSASALNPLSPAFFLSLMFAPPALSSIYCKLLEWSEQNRGQADTYKLTHEKLTTIEPFTHLQMLEFLRLQEIDPARIPIQDLSARPFKILVANYLSAKEILAQKFAATTAARNQAWNASSSTQQRYEICSLESDTWEKILFPMKIQLAMLLQRMYVPSNAIALDTIGTVTTHSFEMRLFLAHQFATPNLLAQQERANPYFTFADGSVISRTEMIPLTISQLHQRIFLRG